MKGERIVGTKKIILHYYQTSPYTLQYNLDVSNTKVNYTTPYCTTTKRIHSSTSIYIYIYSWVGISRYGLEKSDVMAPREIFV